MKKENLRMSICVYPNSLKACYYFQKRMVDTSTTLEVHPIISDNAFDAYEISEKVETKDRFFGVSPDWMFTGCKETGLNAFSFEYLQAYVKRLVSVNLWHVYGAEGNPYIGKLWIESIMRLNEADSITYEEETQEAYQAFLRLVFDLLFSDGYTIEEASKILRISKSKLSQLKKEAKVTFIKKNGVVPVSIESEHNYKMVMTSDGNRKRVEIVPKMELTLSGWFKEWVKNSRILDDSTDVSDMLQEAWLAMLTLIKVGLISDFSDIQRYSGYVFSRVNSFLHSRKLASNVSEFNPEVHVSGSSLDAPEDAIHRVFVEQFIDYCMASMKIRKGAKDNYQYILKHVFSLEESEVEVAKDLILTKQMVSKYVMRIRKFLKSEAAKEFFKNSGYDEYFG